MYVEGAGPVFKCTGSGRECTGWVVQSLTAAKFPEAKISEASFATANLFTANFPTTVLS